MLPVLGLAAITLFAALGSPALAIDQQKGICTLIYKKTVNDTGPCTFFQEGSIVTVQGAIAETGAKYTAIIDNSKNEGLLIGGPFALADGTLAKNDPTEVVWPNGYVLKIEPVK